MKKQPPKTVAQPTKTPKRELPTRFAIESRINAQAKSLSKCTPETIGEALNELFDLRLTYLKVLNLENDVYGVHMSALHCIMDLGTKIGRYAEVVEVYKEQFIKSAILPGADIMKQMAEQCAYAEQSRQLREIIGEFKDAGELQPIGNKILALMEVDGAVSYKTVVQGQGEFIRENPLRWGVVIAAGPDAVIGVGERFGIRRPIAPNGQDSMEYVRLGSGKVKLASLAATNETIIARGKEKVSLETTDLDVMGAAQAVSEAEVAKASEVKIDANALARSEDISTETVQHRRKHGRVITEEDILKNTTIND